MNISTINHNKKCKLHRNECILTGKNCQNTSIEKRRAQSRIARSCRKIGTASNHVAALLALVYSPVLLISSYRALYTREGHNYPQEDGGSALNILALTPCSIADLHLALSLSPTPLWLRTNTSRSVATKIKTDKQRNERRLAS